MAIRVEASVGMGCSIRRGILLALGVGLLIGAFSAPAASTLPYAAVYSADAEKQFDRGLEAYRRKRYPEARESFEKLLKRPANQRSSAGQYMLSRTLFRQGEQALALEAARSLEQRYPGSGYVPYSYLLQADAYVVLRRYFEAATQYAEVLSADAPLEAQARAAENMAALVRNQWINEQGVGKLRVQLGASRLQDALLFGESRWYRRLGWDAQSRSAAARYQRSQPQGRFAAIVAQWSGAPAPAPGTHRPPAAESVQGAGERPRLGLLLPLSGAQRQVGQELQAGVQLANEETGSLFELVVADIGSDYGELPISESQGSQLLRVVQQTRHLIDDEQVLAVVGPVYSDECVAAAAVAQPAGVPLLAPLAQQSGLDQLGDFVFQLSPAPEAQARALAGYAAGPLGLRNLVVLAPLTDFGWAFHREFASAAQSTGARVVHSDWYVPEVTRDFQRVFEEVRRVGLGLPVARPAAPHSPVPDSAGVAGLPDSVDTEDAWADTAVQLVNSVDGLAIVTESFSDATTIAPQVRFHRLQTQILGNDAWYDPESLRRMRPQERGNVEGAVIVSGYSETNPPTRRFLQAFRQRFRREAGYGSHGYDAGRLVMQAWQEGCRDGSAVRDWLAALRGYEGASGRITFADGRRSNTELLLLRVGASGRYLQIGEDGSQTPGAAEWAEPEQPQEEVQDSLPSGAR